MAKPQTYLGAYHTCMIEVFTKIVMQKHGKIYVLLSVEQYIYETIEFSIEKSFIFGNDLVTFLYIGICNMFQSSYLLSSVLLRLTLST